MMIRHPNLKMAIVEKESALAMHQTGHNSGVVHAGIYYTPGSMKVKINKNNYLVFRPTFSCGSSEITLNNMDFVNRILEQRFVKKFLIRPKIVTGKTMRGRFETVVRISLQTQHSSQQDWKIDCCSEQRTSWKNRRSLRSRNEEQRTGSWVGRQRLHSEIRAQVSSKWTLKLILS